MKNIKKINKITNKQFDKIMLCLGGLLFLLLFMKLIQLEPQILEKLEDGSLFKNQEDVVNEGKDLGENPNIRVVIMNQGFKDIYHESLEIEGGTIFIDGKEEEGIDKKITINDSQLKGKEIRIVPDQESIQINSFTRQSGNPQYSGEIEVFYKEKGLVVVNELPLETYLKGVVPSEMPSSYEMEALKAQAVCARTYAYQQMQSYSYKNYKAHVNDSIDYQVYNNIEETENCNQAILETAGEKLGVNNQVVTTYFFSTSSGHTTDVLAWGSEKSQENEYLEAFKVWDGKEYYEKDLPWFSWTMEEDLTTYTEVLELNIQEKIGTLKDIEVLQRGEGDVALKIEITGTNFSKTIEGENAIRKALGNEGLEFTKNDGAKQKELSILPSAFFDITIGEGIITINGGGLGHGIGMSQNGANEMAKAGFTYLEILSSYYKNAEILI